ncbi:9559_t:CDS:2 [Racocetra persica]|uniref:9559_t:CDS:1 n=1 Tax=Racocetra persica TaxID=160502 RepID=A0ACA9RT41_9GLOM|nr:9559_t:CDS:2 [Racocetra persica]
MPPQQQIPPANYYQPLPPQPPEAKVIAAEPPQIQPAKEISLPSEPTTTENFSLIKIIQVNQEGGNQDEPRTKARKKIIIIKTSESSKIRNFLSQEGVNYEIYQEPSKTRAEKLREYIRAKAQENIFADYDEALKDNELEAEKKLLEEMDDEDE